MSWEDGTLVLLDQTRLPTETHYLRLRTYDDVGHAIQEMAVRGAPAIGIAAAYGMVLAAQSGADLKIAARILIATRPTAVNLAWAVQRMLDLDSNNPQILLEEACNIEQRDLEMNLKIGKIGSELIIQNCNIMTICNTGALATAGHGTALGIIRTAHLQGKNIHVWSCETRPRQQGLKLTAYELLHEQIPFHSIADSAAASLMKDGKVDLVLAGADRIASNGDSANKIGTYSLAVLARFHNIPFYIAAPSSTLDPSLCDGSEIPIEERSPKELTQCGEYQIAPSDTPVYNPGFDVTPGDLISAIITETGIFRLPFFK